MAKYKNLVDEIRRKRGDNIILEDDFGEFEAKVEESPEVNETVKQRKRKGK